MELLIDADYIVFKNCASAETELDFGEDVILVTSNFSDAYNATTKELAKLKAELDGSNITHESTLATLRQKHNTTIAEMGDQIDQLNKQKA